MNLERLSSSDNVGTQGEGFRPFNPSIGVIMRANLKNPSREEATKITSIISEYIGNKFAKYEGIPEAAKKLPDHILSGRPSANSKVANRINDEFDSSGSPGFHNSKFNHAFLREQDDEDLDNEGRFQVWLHESFHFVSQENGAGLSPWSDDYSEAFFIPNEYLEDETKLGAIDEGIRALCEGATQIMTEEAELDMGFPEAEISSVYPVEQRLVGSMIDLIGEDKFEEIYLTMSMEELGMRFEALGGDDDSDFAETFPNGHFADFLSEVGECSSYCNQLLEQDNPDYKMIDLCIHECVSLLENYLRITGYLRTDKNEAMS